MHIAAMADFIVFDSYGTVMTPSVWGAHQRLLYSSDISGCGALVTPVTIVQ